MYKWEKYDNNDHFDSKNPTFSSSLLDKINKSLKNNPKNDLEEELSFFRAAKTRDDERMSTLRKTSLVEKWMEKKVLGDHQKVAVTRKCSSNNNNNKGVKLKLSNTLLEEFDAQDTTTLFFSNTSTSSSSSEAEYSAYNYGHPSRQVLLQQQQQKPARGSCFAPPMPKSVRTRPIESEFLEHFEEKDCVKDAELLKSRSRAVKIYSNLKNLKQPVSPGVRLSSFIHSLFAKENNKNKNKSRNKNKNNNDNNIVTKSEKITKTSYSTCTTPSSYSSRSCLINNKVKKFQDDGNTKRTVRFCPVGVILDEDSRPCGQKPVFDDRITTSKFARSLSKRYEELRFLNVLEERSGNNNNNNNNNSKKIEEVALDLLSGYCWDSRPGSKSDKVNNDCDYGVNYGHRKDIYDFGHDDNDNNNDNDNDNDDDGLSCSSSDLFEIDHLSLIGNNELPVYETTRFDAKLR